MVYDVIIAGAGPVGLFLACELRLAKLSVLVLEQLEDPRSPLKRLPFGMRGLWGPSIEAFYRRRIRHPNGFQNFRILRLRWRSGRNITTTIHQPTPAER